MARVIQTSTDLFPILNPWLYESAIDPGTVFGWEQQELAGELPESVNPYEMSIDMDKYLLKLVEFANEAIESHIIPGLKGYGIIDIKATTFHHPSWYQFGSGRCDIMDFNILVEDSFFEKMNGEIATLRTDAEANRYCKEHWTDRPGFWSYMPGSVKELAEGWSYETEGRKLGAYLTLLANRHGLLWRDDRTEEDGEAQKDWEASVSENLYFMDFISDEDAELINSNRVAA